MALDRTRFTGGNYIPNQNFELYYYAPKNKDEIDALTVNLDNMSIQQMKDLKAQDSGYKKLNDGWFVSNEPQHFKGAEGTEDVYKKSGFETNLSEILSRQEFQTMNWRILTNASHIDFNVNGMVRFGDRDFRILSIVYAFSTGTAPNKFKFYKAKNTQDILRYSPKLLILE